MKKLITYIIQKVEDGYYVADVPEFPGCHTQAKTLDELEKRIQEAVLLYLEETNGKFDNISKFVGVYQTEVTVE
ncbi:MAG: hypothetical protein HeimC2_31020 [Candidatus Heimdallarchaeota archaeon LC_2]|nr:MAG: hypothetical protein HeimC2_31020 [Candidatus Heimdallarchaeota archaeon LC_2]